MLIILLHALAGALLATWVALHAEQPWWLPSTMAWVLAAAAGMAALGCWLARRALPPAPGRLRWDGQGWSLVGGVRDQPLQRLVVALDLGRWALLQLHPVVGCSAWRVVSVGGTPGQWHGLRVALAAHAGTPVDAKAAP